MKLKSALGAQLLMLLFGEFSQLVIIMIFITLISKLQSNLYSVHLFALLFALRPEAAFQHGARVAGTSHPQTRIVNLTR